MNRLVEAIYAWWWARKHHAALLALNKYDAFFSWELSPEVTYVIAYDTNKIPRHIIEKAMAYLSLKGIKAVTLPINGLTQEAVDIHEQ